MGNKTPKIIFIIIALAFIFTLIFVNSLTQKTKIVTIPGKVETTTPTNNNGIGV
jgi:uncharacterized protein YoxC